MIQKVPSSRQGSQRGFSPSIWPINHETISISESISELYASTTQSSRTLYNVSLYSGQTEDESISPANLTTKTKCYICGCFWLLNWEPITLGQLDTHLQSLPRREDEVEGIRMEGPFLKLHKHNRCLRIRLTSNEQCLAYNNYEFDSFDRMGRGQLLEYTRGLKKLTLNGVSYFFDGLIRFVESCQWSAAIATLNSVYVISLKNNSGLSQKFNLPDCVDLKWSEKGLYYLLGDGTLGVINKPFIGYPVNPKLFEGIRYQLSDKYSREYKFVRVAEARGNLVALGINQTVPNRIILMVVNKESGMLGNDCLVRDLCEGEKISYINLIQKKGVLELIAICGEGESPSKLVRYTYGVA